MGPRSAVDREFVYIVGRAGGGRAGGRIRAVAAGGAGRVFRCADPRELRKCLGHRGAWFGHRWPTQGLPARAGPHGREGATKVFRGSCHASALGNSA